MWQRCSSLDMDTIPSVLAHGAGLSSATSLRVQAQVRTPPSNWLHEMATCRLFKTKVRTLSLTMSPRLIMLYCSTCKLVGYFSRPPCSL